jgi:hypothetical protein
VWAGARRFGFLQLRNEAKKDKLPQLGIAKIAFGKKRVEAMAVTMRRSAEGGKEKTKNRASSD